MTGFAFFDILDIPAGEFLLQTAASSTLGKQVILLAKHKGIRTINVVRRANVREELLKLGYGCLSILEHADEASRHR